MRTAYVLALCAACAACKEQSAMVQRAVVSRRALRAEAVGCYVVNTDHFLGMADRIRGGVVLALETTHVSKAMPHLRLVSLSDSSAIAALPLRLWSADSLADSIRITLGDGIANVGLVQAITGSREGYAVAIGDVEPRTRILGPTKLVSVNCPVGRNGVLPVLVRG